MGEKRFGLKLCLVMLTGPDLPQLACHPQTTAFILPAQVISKYAILILRDNGPKQYLNLSEFCPPSVKYTLPFVSAMSHKLEDYVDRWDHLNLWCSYY